MEIEVIGTIKGTLGEQLIYIKHHHLRELLQTEANA